MPSAFPGPPRPRFRLRRSSRYPTTSYTGSSAGSASYDDGGSSLTRRGLIGALSLIAVGGVADSIRVLVKGSSEATVGGPPGLSRAVTALIEGHSQSRTGSIASPSASPLATPTHSHAPVPPSHPAAHHHPAGGHAHGHHTAHHHETKKERAARLRRERVKLPPAQLQVRDRPAYQLDQLIPNPPSHALALTIDDGPDPDYTPAVLRLLDKYGTQASFCVVGVHAEAYPKLVRDIARAGHILVNHSYTHTLPFQALSQKRIVWEITKTQQTIEHAAGVTPRLFRAPGGDWSPFIFRALASYGLEPLDWDVDPRDWTRPGTRKIEKRMLRARPGEIVLCHDGGGNRIETVRALRKVLPTWQRKGLAAIPLDITPRYLPGYEPGASPMASPTAT
ncbi:MAG TPA: polysaccharide deacetylase family protein [Mycobacteriales bacterium]|jgi:peptidoglycan/xylan/chitin deacetylase (PgdA/CDA1 family)|nr:polysaccharide deacetylase family protein [Mycobacteriales bacterium]